MIKLSLYPIALAALLAVSCSRTVENKPLEDAKLVIGPTKRDSTLELTPPAAEVMQAALRVNDEEMGTAQYLRLAEDLKAISGQQRSEATGRFARALVEKFRAASDSSPKMKFGQSLYVEAMTGEGEPEVQAQLKVIAGELEHATTALTRLLDDSIKQFPWPSKLENLTEAVSVADGYVEYLIARIPSLGLAPEFSKPLVGALKSEYARTRPQIVSAIQALHRADRLSEAVPTLKNTLKTFGVKMDGEQAVLLAKAAQLGRMIDTLRTPQDALSMLIHVWRMIPANEREGIFRPVSADFYEFLKDKSEMDLRCLEAPLCANPILALARRLVILPKLSEMGVGKIGEMVNSAARDYLLEGVRKEAVGFLPQLPGMVKEQALAEAGKYKSLIRTIQKDMGGFVRRSVDRWARSNFNGEIRGIETAAVKVRMPTQGKLQVVTRPAKNGTLAGAESLGVSLAIAHEFLPTREGDLRAALVEPIAKLMAITGFRRPGGKQFASVLLPLDGPREEVFKIRELLQGKTSFAVPDSFVVSDRFEMDRRKAVADASVAAQAELLRGISRQIRYHRDWEKNQFDDVLGKIQVEDVITDVPKGSVNFSLFPKELIFSLSVGGAGSILQNIIRELSPAFMMVDKDELVWGNEYEKIGTGRISTVAGLVAIEGGQRGRIVRTADVARYVLALDEFLGATEGIENTKAGPLLEKGADGRTVLEQLVEAKRYLRLFMMGLTNYLAYVAQQPDGGFGAEYRLEGARLAGSGARSLTDQVLAIRALTASARRLELNLYTWASLDGYYFLNRVMWNKQTQFYASAVSTEGALSGQPGLRDVASTLRGLEEAAVHMTGESRSQWERISRPWLRALEDF